MYRWHYATPVLTQKRVASFSAFFFCLKARPTQRRRLLATHPERRRQLPQKGKREAGNVNLTTDFIFLASSTSSYPVNDSCGFGSRGHGHLPAAFGTAPTGFAASGQQLADRRALSWRAAAAPEPVRTSPTSGIRGKARCRRSSSKQMIKTDNDSR